MTRGGSGGGGPPARPLVASLWERRGERRVGERLAAIVLAAGRSKRMRSDTPKVLHGVLGLPLVEHVVLAAEAAGAERIVVVVAPDQTGPIGEALQAHDRVAIAVQQEPRGTGHAVAAARDALAGFQGVALVLVGDAPCITPSALERLLQHRRERAAPVAVLSAELPDPTGYGRIVRGPDGDLAAIVEEKDASEHVKALREVSSGVFALELPRALGWLERLTPSAASGELYLTQVVELARLEGARTTAVAAAAPEECLGVNDRAQLAEVTQVIRRRVVARHLANGVTIVDPETAWIDARAEIEQDARIEPFCVISGPCRIERGAVVGPFAHLRAARLGPRARVGCFVEAVRSELGADARALHLAYLGDATLGEGVNAGAGTITANWDGAKHHPTRVGDGVQLGAGTVLIAPAEVGAGARTGAGAVVTAGRPVPPGATWVGVPAHPLEKGAAR